MYKPIDLPKLTRIDSPSGRKYETPEGLLFPSVTTVFSVLQNDSLDEWRKSVGEDQAKRIAARAAKRGTYVHEQAEYFLKGIEPKPNSINKMLYGDLWKSFKTLVEKIGDVYAIEAQIFSKRLEVAGTVDCIGYWEGKLSVIDFKTSTRRKDSKDIDSYWMQTSAYSAMWEELTGQKINDLVILMAVEDDEPLVFKDTADAWLDKFEEVRYTYKTTFGF